MHSEWIQLNLLSSMATYCRRSGIIPTIFLSLLNNSTEEQIRGPLTSASWFYAHFRNIEGKETKQRVFELAEWRIFQLLVFMDVHISWEIFVELSTKELTKQITVREILSYLYNVENHRDHQNPTQLSEYGRRSLEKTAASLGYSDINWSAIALPVWPKTKAQDMFKLPVSEEHRPSIKPKPKILFFGKDI